MRKKDSSDYEPDSLRVMLASLLDYEAAKNATTCLWKVFHSVKTTAASSTWYKCGISDSEWGSRQH